MPLQKERLKKFGSQFLFNLAVRSMHKTIVGGLQDFLKNYKPEDIPSMVKKGKFPSFKNLNFALVSDNAEYLEKITVEKLFEYIAEARPDLAKAIQEMGPAGARYIVKLRLQLLEYASHPDRIMGKSTEYASKDNMSMAKCEHCGGQMPIPKDEPLPEKCPFCGE